MRLPEIEIVLEPTHRERRRRWRESLLPFAFLIAFLLGMLLVISTP